MHCFCNDIANDNSKGKRELPCTNIVFCNSERTFHYLISFEHCVGYVGLYRLCPLNVKSLMDGDYSKDTVHVCTANLSND